MILFINASPKLNNSNSKYFSDLLNIKGSITNYIYNDDFDEIIDNIKMADTIIFTFPTYIDIVPSKLIEFIEYFKYDFSYKKIYVMCNCGFLESSNNDLSILFMKNYIKDKYGIFMGYFSIGSGEAINSIKNSKLVKLICLDFFIKIKKFRNAIIKSDNIFLNSNIKLLTKKSFCKICNHFWNKKINN